MVVVGFVLLLVAALLFVAGIAGSGTGDVTLQLGVFDVSISPLAVFVLGAAAMFLLWLGMLLIRGGIRRSRNRRKDQQKVERLSKELEHAKAEAGQDTSRHSADETAAERDRPTPI